MRRSPTRCSFVPIEVLSFEGFVTEFPCLPVGQSVTLGASEDAPSVALGAEVSKLLVKWRSPLAPEVAGNLATFSDG